MAAATTLREDFNAEDLRALVLLRHIPHSIATLRRHIAHALAQTLQRCPCCAQTIPHRKNHSGIL